MVELIVRLQQATLPVLSACMAVCGLAWIVPRIIRFFSTALKCPWRLFRSQPVVGQIVCGVLVLAWVSFAAVKRGESTNSPLLGLLSALCPTIEEVLPHEVSPAEIASGYYLVEEVESLPLADLPDSCETNDLLRLRGGFDWVFDIAPTNWYFPYRDGYLTNVTVFTRGEVRPSIQQTFFPVPLTNGVSMLPEGRWPLLTNGPSIFRHGVTTNGTLLLDWHNALVGRDLACPTNLQFELAQNGSFAVRTTGRSEVYAPVFPFDWDNDGLANEVDPSPTCADPDAHGTNATWYNTVCSNVFAAVDGPDGVILSPRHVGVNTNAYYFVDVVAEKGPAPICFTADQPGRLGSPVIVAQAGETNQMPLIIGVTYAVTSSVPFEVSVHADDGALIVTNDSQHLTINWPLTFDFAEAIDGSNRIYTVSVEPERMSRVGAFSWDTRSSGGGSSCWHGSTNSVTFTCSSSHACTGDCAAQGVFAYEEVVFSVKGGMCRCGFTDPIAPVASTNTVTSEASLAISFSEESIIFEDTYLDSFKTWKPRRSTRCYLSIFAYGGPDGANLQLTTQNLQKLATIGCGPMIIPAEVTLAPYESYSTVFLCEGVAPSLSSEDVVVSGELVEAQMNTRTLSSNTHLTIVRIELRTDVQASENTNVTRHVFGVEENVRCLQEPSSPSVQWTATGDGNVLSSTPVSYLCPIHAATGGLVAQIGEVNYRPLISVLEPREIVCTRCGYLPAHPQTGIGMALELEVHPKTVAFDGLPMQECPAPSDASAPVWGTHTGYFADEVWRSRWFHTVEFGAGRWMVVSSGNRFAGYDQSRMMVWPQPWRIGELTWTIPIEWKSRYNFRSNQVCRVSTLCHSDWRMTDEALIKEKYGVPLTLTAEGQVFLNGEHEGHE